MAGSGPHGLVADKDGNIWFTANSKGYIGKLNPKTGDTTEYKLPPSTRDPHTPMFDPKGILWFTAQNSNIVGRLDPKTGEVKVVSPPTPKSNPYGMVMDSKGTPWFCQFNVNKLASIDPATMEIKEYTLPNPESRPRRIAITSDDVIWYADYSRGYLGRFETKTGKVTGVRVAWRPEIAALRDYRGQRHRLVQRGEHEAEHAGALRSENGEVPDLGDSLGRRGGAQHDDHQGGQSRSC